MPEMDWNDENEVEALYEGETSKEWRELFEHCVAKGDFIMPPNDSWAAPEEVALSNDEVKLLEKHIGEDMASLWRKQYSHSWIRWALGLCEEAASQGKVSHIVWGVQRELAADARRLAPPGRGYIKRVNERFPGPAARNLLDCWISSDPKVKATAIAMAQLISENPIVDDPNDDDVRAKMIHRAAVSWCPMAWLDPQVVEERTKTILDKVFGAMSAFGGEA